MEYNASWQQVGLFQPDQNLVRELEYGLEKAITQELDPDMKDTDRLYMRIESNTYPQAFCHLFVTAGEWKAGQTQIDQALKDLEESLHHHESFTERDTFHIRLQICQ